MTGTRRWVAALAAVAAILTASLAHAEGGTTSTFQLDAWSFISFEDTEVYPVPTGGSLVFHFGKTDGNGVTPFTITPGDVTIPPIPLPNGGTLTYTLAESASGTASHGPDGDSVTFTAKVNAALSLPEGGGGTTQYLMTFTTHTAGASNTTGTASVTVDGMPLNDAAGAMQLVAATASKDDAFPGPGKAVYTVLSGTFDQSPH